MRFSAKRSRRRRRGHSWQGADPAFSSSRGRSSAAQSTRLSGERSPVRVRSSPLHGGRGVDGSTRGCEPRRRRFEPGRPPLTHADAEHRRAQQAVTLSPRAVVVRLHPSAPRLFDQGDVAQPDERLACNEEDVGSTPTVSTFASVVSTASTRPLYGRGVGSNPAGGSCSRARSSADRVLPCDGRGRWFDSSRAYGGHPGCLTALARGVRLGPVSTQCVGRGCVPWPPGSKQAAVESS